MQDTAILSPQDSLVAIMIAVSAADESIRTAELVQIATIVETLPVFADYDQSQLQRMGPLVLGLVEREDGLDQLFDLVRRYLPERLWETAYALACDVAAADGRITVPEGRILEEIREELALDRLHAAAIERGARARYQTL
jgi:tellurite resistance protein